MLRVLVIEPAGNKWGSERAFLDLLDYLRGVEVAVCLPPRRPLQAELDRRGVRTFGSYIYALHEKTKLHRVIAALGVLWACLRLRPDVIYLNQSGAYKVALVAAFLLRIPMVAHIRIFEDVAYIARQRPSPKLLRGIIAISTAIDEELAAYHALDAIPRHKIFDAYALHNNLADAEDPERVEGRIACVGRVAPVKGQDVLIAALGVIRPGRKPVECLIAGNEDGEFAQHLKRKVAEAPPSATLRWVGVIDDSVGLLKTCIAMVVPSHKEALGRVLFEAWEAGAAPIAFAGSGGAAEIIECSGGGGILYPSQTPASLAAAIQQVLRLKPVERERMIAKGRAWMAEACDPTRYAEKIAAIFAAATRKAPA